MPEHVRLPGAPAGYDDLEAMTHYRYDLDKWDALRPDQWARLMAHWYHRQMRSAYNLEMQMGQSKADPGGQEAPWQRVFNMFTPKKK